MKQAIKKISKKTDGPSAAKDNQASGYMPFVLKPRISEKGYAIFQTLNTYIFDVPATANKHQIAAAASGQYSVTVVGVRLAGVPGKAVRTNRRGSRKSINGRRSDIKKAYVTLKSGDTLPLYAAETAPEALKDTK